MAISAEIRKVVPEERLVFGWAYVSTDESGTLLVDTQGDAIEPAELEKAAYDHVLNFGDTGVSHEGETVGKMVESFMLTPEKAEAMGLPETQAAGWWVGYKLADAEVFAKVKDGTYSMWSIQGSAAETEAS